MQYQFFDGKKVVESYQHTTTGSQLQNKEHRNELDLTSPRTQYKRTKTIQHKNADAK